MTKPTLRIGLLIFGLVACQSPGQSATHIRPAVDPAFWQHWSDGQAELAGYSLTTSRYGETRNGFAVSIFVTETLDHATRVKTAAPQDGAHYPVMKLNLIRDFQTGLYDYNTMLSVFVPLAQNDFLPARHVSKISFSSQEWCGHVYHQLTFERGKIQETIHSYFQNEADQNRLINTAPHVLSEDALLLWARGMSGPQLAPGEQAIVPVVTSLSRARLNHQKVQTTRANLARDLEPKKLKTDVGEFSAQRYTASVEGGPNWEIWVESDFPNRLLKWETSAGERGILRGIFRSDYWNKQQNLDSKLLKKLGLPVPKASNPQDLDPQTSGN